MNARCVGEKYRIIKSLGSGGSSKAFLAKNVMTGEKVTLKELRKDGGRANSFAKKAKDNEAKILKSLDHPAIPRFIENSENTLVLEYIPGKSAEEHIVTKGVFDENSTVKIALELIDILEYLHSRRLPVIYRDLKPSNVIIRPGGHVALIDFGTARFYKSFDKADTTNLGTQGYAAPEQYGNLGQTDPRTDIYCLGMTMLQMISGVDLRDEAAVSRYRLHGVKGISGELMRIIDKCTRPDREDRFDSVREVGNALRAYPGKKRLKKLGFIIKVSLASAAAAFVVSSTTVRAGDIKEWAIEDFEGRLPVLTERMNNVRTRLDVFFEEQLGIIIWRD